MLKYYETGVWAFWYHFLMGLLTKIEKYRREFSIDIRYFCQYRYFYQNPGIHGFPTGRRYNVQFWLKRG